MDIVKTDPSASHLWGSILLACVVTSAIASPALAAPTSPFVGATGGVWDPKGNNIIPEELQIATTGSVRVETGSLPSAYGDFHGQFGTSRFAIQVAGGDNREVFGGSVWSDGFTVAGSGQGGLLTLSTHIDGSVSGLAEMGYALFVSAQPYDLTSVINVIDANHLGFWALSFPDATRVLFSGVSNGCGPSNWSRECGHVPFESFQGTLDTTLSANVPFTQGQSVYVLSLFSGGVGRTGGIESFANSADFGISAPANMTLQSLSGTVYAAAVPESPSGVLLVIGLGLTARLVGRFRAAGSGHPKRSTRVTLPSKQTTDEASLANSGVH